MQPKTDNAQWDDKAPEILQDNLQDSLRRAEVGVFFDPVDRLKTQQSSEALGFFGFAIGLIATGIEFTAKQAKRRLHR